MTHDEFINKLVEINGRRPAVVRFVGIGGVFDSNMENLYDCVAASIHRVLDSFTAFQRRRASPSFLQEIDSGVNEGFDGLAYLYLVEDALEALNFFSGSGINLSDDLLDRIAKVKPAIDRVERKFSSSLSLHKKIDEALSDPDNAQVLLSNIENEMIEKANAEEWQRLRKSGDFGLAIVGLIMLIFIIIGIIMLISGSPLGWVSIVVGVAIALAVQGSISFGIITFWGGGE